jgi:MFS family permease
VVVLTMARGRLAVPNPAAKFRGMFSNSRSVNVLAAARVFLFASRDVWFVVGLPVYLSSVLGWSFWQVGAFLAIWVIGYGIVQASAPRTTRRWGGPEGPDGTTATWLAFVLALPLAAIAIGLTTDLPATPIVVVGLVAFGVVFALSSAVHSFLILRYAEGDRVAMNVGFYYMANACGRLLGTVLSGALYQLGGLTWCLWASVVFVLAAGTLSRLLPSPGRATVDGSAHADAGSEALTTPTSGSG